MAESCERFIEATVSGRYLLRASKGDSPAPLLVGFHGYAEDAAVTLERMTRISGADGWNLCAAQALHPFYRSGSIVASWMTSFDRERAILDNTRYALSVVEAVRDELNCNASVVFVGFSQGVAMAWRAAVAMGEQCGGLISLAGDVPPGILAGSIPTALPVLLARGKDDRLYSEEQLSRDMAELEGKGLSPRVVRFDGRHEWADGFLEAAGEFMRAEGARP